MSQMSLTLAVLGNASGATTALQQVSHSAAQTDDTVGKLGGKLKAALGVGAIVAFGKQSVESFAEAEQSQLKLNAAFEKFPALANSSVESITAIAEARAQTTKFDDDATKAAAAQLAQFKLTGQQIEQILPLVQDYAARTGTDLPEAATKLGKAYLGQTRALKEIGVNYKSTGDAGRDFAAITQLVQDKVGGFAEKQGATASGQLEILTNNFGELQEAVGEAVLPIAGGLVEGVGAALKVVTPLATVIGDTIGWFRDLPGPVQAAALALGAIAVLKLTGVFDGISKRIATMRQNFAMASYETGTFANRISQIRVAQASGQFGTLGSAVRIAGAGLKSFGSAALSAVGGPVGIAVTAGLTLITLGFSKLAEQAARSRQIQDEQKQSLSTLVEQLAENNGVIDENIRKTALSELANASWGRESKNLLDLAGRLGVTQSQLVEATLGDAKAQETVRAAIARRRDELTKLAQQAQYGNPGAAQKAAEELRIFEEQTAAFEPRMLSTQQLAEQQKQYNDTVAGGSKADTDAALAAVKHAAALGDLTAGTVSAQVAVENVRTATGMLTLAQMDATTEAQAHNVAANRLLGTLDQQATAVATAAGELTPMAAAAEKAADAQSRLDDSTRAIVTRLDEMAGRIPTVEQANSDLFDSVSQLADAFGVGTKEARKLEAGVQAADGTFNLGTKSGRELRDQTLGVREAMATAAKAAYDQAIANGDLKGAQEKANYAARVGYDEFVRTATSILGSKSAAEQAARAYGLIPGEVTTAIVVQNQEAMQRISAIAVGLSGLAQSVTTAFVNVVTGYSTQGSPPPGVNGAGYTGGRIAELMGYAKPFAAGGKLVTGKIPGTPPADPRKDNLLGVLETGDLIAVRSKEFIVSEPATARNEKALEWMNAGGTIPGFTTGGSPGNLAGRTPRALGDRESRVTDAIDDVRSWFDELVKSADAAGRTAREAAKASKEAAEDRQRTAAEGAAGVSSARLGASRDLLAAREDARRSEAEQISKNNEKIAAAEKRLADARGRTAKTADQQRAKAKAIADAETGLANARSKAEKALTDVRSKNAAAVAKADADGKAAVKKARDEERKNNAAAVVKAQTARAEADATNRSAQILQRRAEAERQAMAATKQGMLVLSSLGRRADQLSAKLANSTDKLRGLQSDRAQMVSSIGSQIAGFGGGLTGFADSRNTVGSIIAGQKFNAGKIDTFKSNLRKLSSLGLSADQLEELSTGGEDGMRQAAVLAGASRSEIAQLNSLRSRINSSSTAAASVAASAKYDKQIAQAAKETRDLRAQLKDTIAMVEKLGDALDDGLALKIDAQGLARVVRQGENQLNKRGG